MAPKITIAASTAICALSASMAIAQSGSASDNGTANERSPDTVTCADITAMETALVPGTLYYIAGYKEGSGSGTSMGESSAPTESAEASEAASGDAAATTAADGSTVTSDANTSADSDTDETAADAMTSADGSQITSDANTSASTTGEGESDSSQAADTAGDQSGTPDGDVTIVRVSGMFEIPVEEVITVCTDSPEMTASDAIEQKRSESNAGSTSN